MSMGGVAEMGTGGWKRRAAVRGDMQESDHQGTNQSSTVTP